MKRTLYQSTKIIIKINYHQNVSFLTICGCFLHTGGETENSADFLQKFSPPAIIGIIGGTLIALVIGLVCICLFVRRMHKREDAEVVNQPSLSFGATMVSTGYNAAV